MESPRNHISLPRWFNFKYILTIITLMTVVSGMAWSVFEFVGNQQDIITGQAGLRANLATSKEEADEARKGSDTKIELAITSVKSDLRSLELRIIDVENSDRNQNKKFEEEKEFVKNVTLRLEEHGKSHTRTETLLEQILKKLE